MKLGRIKLQGLDGTIERIVLVKPDEGRVIDLRQAEVQRLVGRGATLQAARRCADAVFPSSMSAAIALGEQFLDVAADAAHAAGDDHSLPIDQVRWAPASDPSVVRDGLSFKKHIINFLNKMNMDKLPSFVQIPGYFKGTPWTVIGHEDVVPWPGYIKQMDYELELGYVMGRPAHNIHPDDARAHIFGVTIFNDFSGRDLQSREMPIGMGATKSKDFAYGVGPWIATVDEFDRFDTLQMTVRVNGEVWGGGQSDGLLWQPEELIAYVSLGDHIQPGDVIGSGTVGTGSALEVGKSLSPGDVVELEVSGIGILRNRMGEPEQGLWWPTEREPFL